jgi:hypothetical protein
MVSIEGDSLIQSWLLRFRAIKPEFIANVKFLVLVKKCVCNLGQIKQCNATIEVKRYVKENWGSPFIAGFLLILIAAATLLSFGLSYLSNTMAVYAFYGLVLGVVLQLVCFVKYLPKDESESI